MRGSCWALWAAALVCGACEVELRPGTLRCDDLHRCPEGWSCRANLCYPDQESRSLARIPDAAEDSSSGGGVDGGVLDAAPAPATATDGGDTRSPDAAESAAEAGAAGGSGSTSGDSAAPDSGGESEPDAAVGCRESRACYDGPSATRAVGICRDGEQACRDGEYALCLGSSGPQVEVCNGLDDDCDGASDERIELSCYPSSAGGCVYLNATLSCMGVCRAGKQSCRDGRLSDCEEAVVPGTESCTSEPPAADENCNGATDEVCECTPELSPRECYTGPAGTAGVGPCRQGSQTCSSGSWTACDGAVAPQAETCANPGSDDDCNGVADDVVGASDPCPGPLPGVCATGRLECQSGVLACVSPVQSAELCNAADDDCDGLTDEAFNLNTDPAHCGGCNIACAEGESCCTGVCRMPLECPDGTVLRCGIKCPLCGRSCQER
jgi:Putative metal-binding motif